MQPIHSNSGGQSSIVEGGIAHIYSIDNDGRLVYHLSTPALGLGTFTTRQLATLLLLHMAAQQLSFLNI